MGKRIKTSEKTEVVALMLFILIEFFASNSFMVVKAEIEDADYVIQTTVTFSNNGTTVWNLTKEDQEISLFMNNTWQTVYLTSSSSPIEKTEPDEDGNPLALLELPKSKLEPGETVNYTVTYSIKSEPRSIPPINEQESKNLTEIPSDLKEEYLDGSNTWQIDDPTLQETARTIAGNETNVLLIVEEFVEWIWNNIDYPPQATPKTSHEVPLHPNQTLLYREGDCDDQAILLITFCRILGIPSYLQVGCIYRHETTEQHSSWNGTVTSVLKNIGWHGWAMVYIPPSGWLPVDLTYVIGGPGIPLNPLNAIRAGAVTSSKTIQYINISKRDYAASSRNYREFLIENQFYIYQEDRMNMTSTNPLNDLVETGVWLLPIALSVATGTMVVVFVYILKVERRRSRESDKQ